MKSRVILVLSFLLIGMMLATPASAQTSQNFEWEVEIGDMSYFSFYYWEEMSGTTIDEDIYLNITGPIDAVPDPLTDWWDIPDINADIKFVNGTDIGIMATVFLYTWKIAVPTGNWTLLKELIESVTEYNLMETIFPVEPFVTLDDWLRWGFSYNLTSGPYTNVVNVEYLKSDGSLAAYYVTGYNTSQFMIGQFIFLRDGTAPVISGPADISYTVGTTGHNITWSATDQSPGGYRILKDSVEVQKGFWNSSSEKIVVSVDGLSVGSYDYEVEFYEASGISSSDVVTVTVNAETTTTTTTTSTTTTGTSATGNFISENLMLILGVGGAVIIIIIIVVIVKKK